MIFQLQGCNISHINGWLRIRFPTTGVQYTSHNVTTQYPLTSWKDKVLHWLFCLSLMENNQREWHSFIHAKHTSVLVPTPFLMTKPKSPRPCHTWSQAELQSGPLKYSAGRNKKRTRAYADSLTGKTSRTSSGKNFVCWRGVIQQSLSVASYPCITRDIIFC